MSEPYKTLCDSCYQGTWYEIEQPCKRTTSTGCNTCGSHEYISKQKPCTGTLRVIDNSNLATKFDYFYKNKQRIEVLTIDGELLRGYVSKTTGWRPSYLLMAKSNSNSSSELLDDTYTVTKTINRYR